VTITLDTYHYYQSPGIFTLDTYFSNVDQEGGAPYKFTGE